MLAHLLTSTLLLGAFLLLRGLLRTRIPARLTYALGLLVLVRVCLPLAPIALDLPILPAAPPAVSGPSSPSDAVPSDTTEAGQGQTGVYLPVIPGMPVSSSALTGTLTETLTEMPPAAVETRPSASVRPTPGTTAPNARPSVPAITLDDEILLRAVYILWGAGSVVSLLWFGGSAVMFALRLRRSRRPCGKVGRTRVWVTETIDTPCLAGLPPAVYLTPAAADTSAKAMVLWHEYSHLRQGDWLWAPLRTLVLCLYWFNPLVWAVVACTKQDAELACDEAVAAQLDEAGRLRYARMIVDMLPPVPSRAVGFGAGTVRERILMLTTERKNRILAAVLALVLVIGAVGCSFVAPNPVSRTGDDPSVTNDPTRTDAVQLSEQITLQSSTGELTFRVLDLPAVPGEYDVFPYDDRYQLYHVRGEAPTLYLFDPETGTFAADCAMPYNGRLASVSYTDDGLILYDYTRQDAAFAVSYTEGVLRVRETEVPSEVRSLPIVSPNGLYRVCAVTDAAGKGGIDLITADGGVRRIIPHESGSLNTPLAFRDGTSFYYQIGARLPQLAVYDILSGNSTPVWHEDAQQLLGTYGGTVYFGRMMDDDIPVSLGSSRGEGSTSVSYVFTEAERSLYAPFDRHIRMAGGKWFLAAADSPLTAENLADSYGVMTTVQIKSADCSQVLANLRMPFGLWYNAQISLSGALCTLVLPEVEITSSGADVSSGEFITVLTNPGGLTFTQLQMPTKYPYYTQKCYDETHLLFYSYARETDAQGNVLRWVNQHLWLFDTETGQLVADCALEGEERLSASIRTDAGFILYERAYDDATGEVTTVDARRIVYADGRLSAEPIDYEPYPERELFLSPDGSVRVYDVYDRSGKGGIELVMPDGSVRQVLTDVPLEEARSLGDVIGYSPVGFVDDTHLLYHIGGYEWSRGYGVLDVTTGECRTLDFLHNHTVYAIRDGKIYARSYIPGNETYEKIFTALWRYTLDGTATLLADADAPINPFSISFDASGLGFRFDLAALSPLPDSVAVDYAVPCTVYSLDLEVLATLLVPYSAASAGVTPADDGGELVSGSRTVTLVLPAGAVPPSKSPIPADTLQQGVLSSVEVLAQQDVDLRVIGIPLEEGEEIHHYYDYENAQSYDARYQLSLIYRKTGDVYTDMRLWLFDTIQGQFTASTTLPDGGRPLYIAAAEEGCVIYADKFDEAAQERRFVSSFSVLYERGLLTATPITLDEAPDTPKVLLSPDQRHSVRNVDEPDGRGGIDVTWEGGKVERILSHVTVEDGGMYDSARYRAVGFLVPSRLVYNISGWESSAGFGIYDLVTCENIVSSDWARLQVAGIGWDGKIYAQEDAQNYAYTQSRVWQIDGDGNMRLLREFTDDEQRGLEWMRLHHFWREGIWISDDTTAVKDEYDAARRGEIPVTVELRAADYTPLATLRMPYLTYMSLFNQNGCTVHSAVYGTTVCMLLPMPIA